MVSTRMFVHDHITSNSSRQAHQEPQLVVRYAVLTARALGQPKHSQRRQLAQHGQKALVVLVVQAVVGVEAELLQVAPVKSHVACLILRIQSRPCIESIQSYSCFASMRTQFPPFRLGESRILFSHQHMCSSGTYAYSLERLTNIHARGHQHV